MNGFTKYWNRPDRAAYLFLTPSFLVLLLFTVVPLLGTFAVSFTDLNIFFTSGNFASFEDFTRIFSDERTANSLAHSSYFTILETPTQIVVSLLAAVALSKSARLSHFRRSIFYIPVIRSLTSIAIIFSMLLDPNVGAAPYLFSRIGLPIPQFFRDPTLAMPVVAVITVWGNFNATMTVLLAAIQGISPSLYESAQMGDTTNRQQFFNIILPQIVLSLGFCILANLIGLMQVFGQIHVATAGDPQFKTKITVQYIYSRGFTAPYELGYASVLSSVLFIIVATIAISTNVYMSREEKQTR